MRIILAKDYEDMSQKAANLIAAQISLKPNSVLGLATGSSPIGAYQNLIESYKKGQISFAQTVSINLDEYVGLAQNSPQSYRFFMDENLFNHVDIDKNRSFVPNGLAADAKEECARYEGIIKQFGGVDLQLLGLGNNGHIGFNEPAQNFEKETHKVALTESTIKANRRFFAKEEDVPRFAYTMGIGSIIKARHIVLIASGVGKAQVLKDAFLGPVTPQLPASILQFHPNVCLVADETAMSLLI